MLDDVIVVDGDPVRDRTLLKPDKGLLAVMKGGRFVHSQLDNLAGGQHRTAAE